MSLNPNGITIQDLAYWLRQTYKNQYDHIESDRELVNHFKNSFVRIKTFEDLKSVQENRLEYIKTILKL